MNAIEWSAYLVLHGMLPIHEAAERVLTAKPKRVRTYTREQKIQRALQAKAKRDRIKRERV